MTRQEIIDRIKVARQWNHYCSNCGEWLEVWQDAFTLYDATHGLTGKEKMRTNCHGCFNTVKAWLETGKG